MVLSSRKKRAKRSEKIEKVGAMEGSVFFSCERGQLLTWNTDNLIKQTFQRRPDIRFRVIDCCDWLARRTGHKHKLLHGAPMRHINGLATGNSRVGCFVYRSSLQ